MGGGAKVVVEAHRHAGVFVARGKEDALVTRNLVPGVSVYAEKRISTEVPKADGEGTDKVRGCIALQAYTHRHAHNIHTHTHTRTHALSCTNKHACTRNTRTRAHTHTHTRMHAQAGKHARKYACTNKHRHAQEHTHTHTQHTCIHNSCVLCTLTTALGCVSVINTICHKPYKFSYNWLACR